VGEQPGAVAAVVSVEASDMRAQLSSKFWKGRRVFVAGHTGFKGGWLVTVLNRHGAQVSGYALPPHTEPNRFGAARIGELCRSIFGDIRDADALASAMGTAEPEIVFHLAAQALVRPSLAKPIETISTNVVGTAQILESVRVTPSVKGAVVVTSDKVYDNVEWVWAYRENDRLGGKEPYGASKACAEIVVEAYRHSFFSGKERTTPIATARAGNVIGGGDWAQDRIVPDAMRAFSQGKPLLVRNPAAIRPWQHVLEPLSGYLRLAEALLDATSLPRELTFNFGPQADDAVRVSIISDRLAARWGKGASWQQDSGYQPYEAHLLELDSAKARASLGWGPRWRLDDALNHTVDWYKAFYAGQDMQAFSFAQVDGYLDG
jgi:CDP-glucose 4,6-dehydratase